MRLVPRAWRRFLHPRHGEPYHEVNSRRGILRAFALGIGIDLDLNMTLDGVGVITHWLRPLLLDGFRAPKGSGIRRWARIDRLTWAQVQTLRTADGYRIRRVEDQLRFAAEVGVKRVELEPKRSRGLARPRLWRDIRRAAPAGLLVVVKCISRNPRCHAILAAAKTAGFTTMVLARGRFTPAAWRDVADYVRGSRLS